MSVETPVSFALPARDAGACNRSAPAIGGLRELTAHFASAAVFPDRREIAVCIAMAPFIAPADIAVQPGCVNLECSGLFIAVDVAGNCVAENATQDRKSVV